MKKLSIKAQKSANGGKHYYVYKCPKCSVATQYSYVGHVALWAHMKNYNHGKWGDAVTKDVCIAMGNTSCNVKK
jgi:hypothetical protein